jgi:hypothetical protein
MRYATGSVWYGRQHLFGPQTGYHRADDVFRFRQEGNQIAGYEVQLYRQVNGNLRTSEISASEWGDDAQQGE